MIEINLVPEKKRFAMPSIMGINLADFNIPLLAIAIVLNYAPKFIVEPKFESELKEKDTVLNEKKSQLQKLKQKSVGKKDITKQIEEWNLQEKQLKDRLEIVKKVIKEKKNPMKVLHYMSQNIPKEVWVNTISIDDGLVKIVGESGSYKSIGVFLENLQKAVFFENGMPRLVDSRTVENSDLGVRTQSFVFEGRIKRYE